MTRVGEPGWNHAFPGTAADHYALGHRVEGWIGTLRGRPAGHGPIYNGAADRLPNVRRDDRKLSKRQYLQRVRTLELDLDSHGVNRNRTGNRGHAVPKVQRWHVPVR